MVTGALCFLGYFRLSRGPLADFLDGVNYQMDTAASIYCTLHSSIYIIGGYNAMVTQQHIIVIITVTHLSLLSLTLYTEPEVGFIVGFAVRYSVVHV